jgi:hypothetical protein
MRRALASAHVATVARPSSSLRDPILEDVAMPFRGWHVPGMSAEALPDGFQKPYLLGNGH